MRDTLRKTIQLKLTTVIAIALMALTLIAVAAPAQAQATPSFTPDQLDQIVARIALYPDPLIAQILAAATYPMDIPDAAKWADEHHYLTGDDLAKAIQDDMLPWDPSVQALLPFPSVLETMASDINWTTDLGNAFLAEHDAVMDAIQTERHRAYMYGYLRTNAQIVVGAGPYITIMPVNPGVVVVPWYNPLVVFAAPGPGFVVGGAIRFGYFVNIGVAFRPWGWGVGLTTFDWAHRALILDAHPWGRNWANRATYVHPYAGVRRWDTGRRAESHVLHARTDRERAAARQGRARVEEHDRR